MDSRARVVSSEDFRRFDLILAMDRQNLADLLAMPGADPAKVRLIRSFDPAAGGDEVPDPYYGLPEDYDRVADMLEAAAVGVLQQVRG